MGTELKTLTLDDGNEMLLEDFTYFDVTVPAGFVTDGASVPRVFWPILPPYKRTKKAAVVHDYLCRHVVKTYDERKSADKLFKEMLIDSGESRFRASLAYAGLRIAAAFGILGKHDSR